MSRWKQRARAMAVAASLATAAWISSSALLVVDFHRPITPTTAWSAPDLGVAPDRIRLQETRAVEAPSDSVNPTEPPPWPARRVLRMAFAQATP